MRYLSERSSPAPACPPFSTEIKFSSINVNHEAFSDLSPSGFSDVDPSNKVKIRTSALSRGKTFTLTYVKNS
jgi:hypothetical protein